MAPPNAERAAPGVSGNGPRETDHAGQRERSLDNQPKARAPATSNWRKQYKVHPAADVFDMMADDELVVMGEDIKQHGLKHPIVMFVTTRPTNNGRFKTVSRRLLDGRNRLEAMERAGLGTELPEGLVKTITRIEGSEAEAEAAAHIIGLNIHRRHLTKQQQADLIVAAIATAEKPGHRGPVSEAKGGRGKRNPIREKALAVNAELPKEKQVSERTIKRALAKAEGRILQPKTVVRPKLRSKPRLETHVGIDAARKYYLEQCAAPDVDLDAEQEIIIDALREIAGKRAMRCEGDLEVPDFLRRKRASTSPQEGRSDVPVNDPTSEIAPASRGRRP